MASYVKFDRVQGADSMPIRLDVSEIKAVEPGMTNERCIIALKSGHRILINGSKEGAKQAIDEARKSDDSDAYILENAF